jgi:DNA-binding transcriptional MerR regulator
MDAPGYSVGQAAAFARITVRTLHHYDEIGLLTPHGRSAAGHRRYDDADLDRLQQILFYRELGFPLDEVAVLLDDPDADPQAHLRRQHALLTDRIGRLQRTAEAVQRTMEARTMGINLTPEEKFEVFGNFDPDRHAEEVRDRWGTTEAYAQSQARAASYTKEDWLRIKAAQDDWSARITAAMAAGEPADGERATGLAEEHRAMISRFFYDCGYATHTGLAGMYLADERFTAYYEAIAPGLAQYLHDAILANARRRS